MAAMTHDEPQRIDGATPAGRLRRLRRPAVSRPPMREAV
ncbi:MAG: hypothetical protein QOE86_797, partial [Solirubrobacteraceae bacterium]|nr:hypothetical protein [Solirubrobacteraceae bacterium]